MDAGTILQISRALSATVVIISFFMKLPQISNLLSSRSTEGINLRSYWLEMGAYLIGFLYGYTYGYHISIYAESGLLALQNAVIMSLVIHYNKKWTVENMFYFLVYATFVIASFWKLTPHLVLDVLLFLTLPLSVLSKVGQITAIFQLKSCGNVSVLTWSLATYGCVVRFFTNIVEVGNLQILLNFAVSSILNGIVVAMCLYYGEEK